MLEGVIIKRIFIFVFLLFLLTGCSKEAGKYLSEEKIDEVEEVSIDVLNDTITNKSLEIKIENNTDESITFNTTDWFMEVYQYQAWYHYAITVSWIGEEKTIDTNSFIKEKIEFEALYGKLKKGTYRIVKHVNNWYLADIFVIK